MEVNNGEIPAWIGKDMIFPIESITLSNVELGQGNYGVITKARVRLGISE